jgi:hypothetical protein
MRAAFEAIRLAIYAHILDSAAALALGPFQFSSRLRSRPISLHRWRGRPYVPRGIYGAHRKPNLCVDAPACRPERFRLGCRQTYQS